MSLTPAHIKYYRSSVGDSEGGSITTTQIAKTTLSSNASSGASSISVHDAAPFVAGDEILISDGTNKEKKVITAISSNVLSLDSALQNSYLAGTPVAKFHCLFPEITAQEASNGIIRYRKFFIRNTSSSLTWYGVRLWISNQPNNAAISLGLGLNDTNDADSNQGNMSALTSNSRIALVSDGADTRQVTLRGLNASGVLITETVTLNGTNEVLSTNTFSRLYFAYVSAINSSRTITIRQGSGGATRGTIGPNKICCWLWFGKRYVSGSLADAEGGDIPNENNAILLGDIAPNGVCGIWVRLQVPAGAGAVFGNNYILETKGQAA